MSEESKGGGGAGAGDPNRKFDLASKEEGMDLLRDAAKLFAHAMVWTKGKGNEKVITTTIHLMSEAEGSLYLTLPKDV